MRPCCFITLLLATAVGSSLSAAEVGYHSAKAPADLASAPAFPSDWLRTAGTAVDVSFLLDAPAGRNGRIGLRDGHLATGDGRRFRIWGINATGPAGLPAKENAPRIAEALARHGINAVRFHFLDRPAPRGIIAADRDDTRELDPAQLEKLDWFVAELKRCGIYSDLNLNVARAYKPGDGVKDHELLGFAKAVTFFDARLLELQREYARQLLTHRNPYTGTAYATEPAVALVEFVNENSLVEAWKDGRLRGAATRKNPGTWSDIPASYAADLTARYNEWLRAMHPPAAVARWRQQAGVAPDAPLPRLLPDQFAAADSERFHAEASFYLAIEREFYLGMAKFIREELGVQALLLGNSDHGHSRTGYPQLAGTSLLDVVDGHVYWQHPKYITDPQTGRQTGFTIGNTPMVDEPLFSTVVELSRSAFAGKPYTVSEVNHPFPHEYACEGIPLLAAYGAFQDWDGIFWYTLAHQDVVAAEPKNGGHFDLATDPVKMAQLPVGALLFLRGDVAPARQTIARTYTPEQVRESLLLPYQARPYFTPGFPPDLALRHASRISSLEGPATGAFVVEAPSPLRSDTGELLWQAGAKRTGLVTVDTPRTQALVGFVGEYRAQLKNIAAAAETPFCALTVSSLDAGTIDRAERLLVTATARVANSGMEWNAKRDSLVSWGSAPTRIEAVRATLRLSGIEGAHSISVVALNSAGAPAGAAVSATREQDRWLVRLNAPATSYLLTVQR